MFVQSTWKIIIITRTYGLSALMMNIHVDATNNDGLWKGSAALFALFCWIFNFEHPSDLWFQNISIHELPVENKKKYFNAPEFSIKVEMRIYVRTNT